MNANAIRFRSGTLDSLRGLTLFSMIAYHLCWDLVYLRGLPWAWYNGFWAYIWQQGIRAGRGTCGSRASAGPLFCSPGIAVRPAATLSAGERSASSAVPPCLWQQLW